MTEREIIGYLVKADGEIIAATGDEREAIYIARNWNGIVFKVTTRVVPLEDPRTVRSVVYDGTI